MNVRTAEIEAKIKELFSVFEVDISQMKQGLVWLGQLRELLVKRDTTSLERLLEQIRKDTGGYEDNQSKRREIRCQIADILGWPEKQVRLSELEKIVSDSLKGEIRRYKVELGGLLQKLAAEHRVTVVLISELARFNRALLEGIFGRGRISDITYDAAGSMKSGTDAAFVSFKL